MLALDCDRCTIADALDLMAHGGRTSERSRPVRTYAAGRVEYDVHAREVYSYGRHFPLLRFVPRGARSAPLIVLNGDVWRGPRSRTPDHQAMARELAAALGETVVIPFSALEGARLELDSIRPIHTRPDANWTETVTVRTLEEVPHWRRIGSLAPDEDGSYSWQEWRHRLGDCLFSAVREESYLRPARPFEVSRALERGRGRVEVAWRERYCSQAPAATDNRSDLHEAGPSGACIYCGRELESRVTVRRRAVYLSSFDYQEPAPLYFLAELPRGAGARTVEEALEALAPRAVHAARARSIPVHRQGDLFFIRTPLQLVDLETRGIVARARLTQWTRDAMARPGETGYVRPMNARERRAMARFRREEWRRVFRGALAQLSAPRPDESFEDKRARRARRAAEWRELAARHSLERAAALGAGAAYDARESSPCDSCGAPVGVECDTAHGSRFGCYKREALAVRHRRELEGFRNAAGTGAYAYPGRPSTTTRGARRQWAKRRAEHAAALAEDRARLRAAALGAAPRFRSYHSADRYSEVQRYSNLTPLQYERRGIAERARNARSRYEALKALGARDSLENRSRAMARDSYRAPFRAGAPARVAWGLADAAARARFMPARYDGPTIEARRARVRRAVSIYGTAHSATEVIRTRAGAVYVRGTVRHAPTLEPGRDARPDHRPLELEPDVWYLAVRNTVPRQRARGRL